MSALEQATILSSDLCLNGNLSTRCQGCACTQCVNILLGAGCRARMQGREGDKSLPALDWILGRASELARRRYVYHMRELRDLRPQSDLLGRRPPKWQKEEQANHKPKEDYGWAFEEIENGDVAELLYRHGFRPNSSIFLKRIFIDSEYIWCESDIGIYSAHYAYYIFTYYGRKYNSRIDESEAINEFSAVVMRRNLTDGCVCHCSVGGCSPFTWMMKRNHSIDKNNDVRWFYRICSLEVATLTYEAAIRYITFRALGLAHTCCNAPDPLEADEENWDEPTWMTKEDVHIINDEQASLLELHENLVAEFIEAATPYLASNSEGGTLLPQFLEEYWEVRVQEELECLNGNQLTDAERQGAEEVGVRWCEEMEGNPYGVRQLEHWLFELDLICPEYREPWPEGLHQIEELP
ncbi:uncharacterized protein PG998_006526 [Apiospora kogelbergensis]|uniref:uncharacterized protein n=1 Tax=Apiospora kogelbergensis TaxID=1337665 RepID=UPI00312EAFC8